MENNQIKLVKVSKENIPLAIEMQAKIFPTEKSAEQIIDGVEKNNPINYIAYNNNKPVGITGFYFNAKLDEHVFLNWYGVLESERKKGYGSEILRQTILLSKQFNKPFFTFWTGKQNIDALKLYKKMGFKVEKYAHKDDVQKLNEMGVKDSFYIGSYALNGQTNRSFKDLPINISKQFEILRKEN